MKFYKTTAILIIICAAQLNAQWSGFGLEDENVLEGSAGMTWIGNKAYYTVGFTPDISIGKLGIGLGINLLYSAETGKIRAQDWDDTYDFFRIIRYLRWGRKGDSFHTRIGALEFTRLGHGFLMNHYSNQIHYDQRKLGLVLDIDFGKAGFESLTSNLDRKEVIGGRLYYRPLYGNDIPVLKYIALGASFLTDSDPDGLVSSKNSVSAWSIDIEMPLLRTDFWKVLLYADHAQIVNYGNGQAIGIGTDFHPFGLLKLGMNFEKRFMSDGFIPNFFGPLYEIHRQTTLGDLTDYYITAGGDTSGIPQYLKSADPLTMAAKHELLPMINRSRSGWFGGLYADFLGLVRMMGSYEMMDDISQSGNLYLGARLSQSIPIVAMEAVYHKQGMDKLQDIFTLDHRSIARVGIGWKIKSFLHLYMDYIWHFEWDAEIGQYKPQERVQPRIAFRYPFGGF